MAFTLAAHLLSVTRHHVKVECTSCNSKHTIKAPQEGTQWIWMKKHGMTVRCGPLGSGTNQRTTIAVRPLDSCRFEIDRRKMKLVLVGDVTANDEGDELDVLVQDLSRKLSIKSAQVSIDIASSCIANDMIVRVHHNDPPPQDYSFDVYDYSSNGLVCGLPETRTKVEKASALLVRQSQASVLVTVSGWSEQSHFDHQLGNVHWTVESFEMCQIIGHTLEPHKYDRGVPGRFHACHPEKQSLAYVPNHTLRSAGDNGDLERFRDLRSLIH